MGNIESQIESEYNKFQPYLAKKKELDKGMTKAKDEAEKTTIKKDIKALQDKYRPINNKLDSLLRKLLNNTGQTRPSISEKLY